MDELVSTKAKEASSLLMAGPRNKAHVRAQRSRLKHTLLILVALVSLATSTVVVYSQTSVQAPLLAKTVVLDGRVTSPDEWSDTTGTPLAMFLREGTEKKDGVLWAKHDGEWLYLLFRVERLSSDNPKDGCGVYYHWGPGAVGTKAKLSDSAEVSKRGITQDSYGYDGTRWYDDVGDGGTNDVQGTATQDSTYLWCELRKMLDSGDTKHDWILSVGKTYGATDEQMFAGVLDANAEKAYNAALTLSLLQTPMPPASTATTAIGGPGTTSIAQTQTTVRQTPVALPAIVGVVAVVAVASFLMLKRRKPTAAITVQDRKAPEALPPEALPPSGPTVSTGYADLDRTLAGGLPEGYAILLVSPSCDERDLLLRKIIESGVSSGKPTFYISLDIGRTRDLANRFQKNFYAFCPQADKIGTANVYGIPRIENLSDLNIALSKTVTDSGLEKTPNKILVLDILSDVLLHHKSLTTRKWLTDFVEKRKAQGFTTLATLSPLITSKEETHTIIDFFDGIIEIYEKPLQERSRRFLVVKKMYGRRYLETELLMDKDVLF